MGGFPSGQRGQTVNLLVNLSEVRILHHPLSLIRHIMCPSGGTGRRTGLKILRELNPVPVRFRSRAVFINHLKGGFFIFNLILYFSFIK